jgi:drug/metabolite transporter (DMT)-like permease
MASTSKSFSGTDWALMLTLAMLWGGAFFFIAKILEEVPPYTMVLLRLAFATPPLFVVLYMNGQNFRLPTKVYGYFLILGAMNVAFPFILFAWAQLKISSGLASVLNATTPLWGVLVAHLLTRDDKATPMRILGVVLGFAGVATMMGAGLETASSVTILAQLACVVATLCYALSSIFAAKLYNEGVSTLQLATGQTLAGAIFMLPVVLATETPWANPVPSLSVLGYMIALSLLSTTLAYILYFKLLSRVGAANSLAITFLIPVVAIALGAIFLGETMTLAQFSGIGLIALGLVVLDGRLVRRVLPS